MGYTPNVGAVSVALEADGTTLAPPPAANVLPVAHAAHRFAAFSHLFNYLLLALGLENLTSGDRKTMCNGIFFCIFCFFCICCQLIVFSQIKCPGTKEVGKPLQYFCRKGFPLFIPLLSLSLHVSYTLARARFLSLSLSLSLFLSLSLSLSLSCSLSSSLPHSLRPYLPPSFYAKLIDNFSHESDVTSLKTPF